LSIIKNSEQRRRLSKLRISAHKLQIEIGRISMWKERGETHKHVILFGTWKGIRPFG
jgi:hypothetical protein